MRKLFRHHRGGLAESLATTVEVNNFADIEKIVNEVWGDFCSNLNTNYVADDSWRAGKSGKQPITLLPILRMDINKRA